MIGKRIFQNLFNDIFIEDVNNGVVQISCDSEYKKEKILKDYKASLKQALKKASGQNLDIELNLRSSKKTVKDKYEYHNPQEEINLFSETEKKQDILEKKLYESQLNPRYLFPTSL